MAAAEPQQSIFKEVVLQRAGEDLVAVAHIGVDHLVLCVGPSHRNVAAGKCVFEPKRIIGRRERHQHFDIRAVAGIWLPAIPLVGGRLKTRRDAFHSRMRRIIDGQRSRQRRPTVAVENRSQKVGEPWPGFATVHVPRNVEA